MMTAPPEFSPFFTSRLAGHWVIRNPTTGGFFRIHRDDTKAVVTFSSKEDAASFIVRYSIPDGAEPYLVPNTNPLN